MVTHTLLSYGVEASRIRIVQPPWKKPGSMSSPVAMLGLAAFCSLFLVAGVFLIMQGESIGGAAFCGAGLLLDASIVGYLAHELTVEIGPGEITIERVRSLFLVWHPVNEK